MLRPEDSPHLSIYICRTKYNLNAYFYMQINYLTLQNYWKNQDFLSLALVSLAFLSALAALAGSFLSEFSL